jgi:hypothetical protein
MIHENKKMIFWTEVMCRSHEMKLCPIYRRFVSLRECVGEPKGFSLMVWYVGGIFPENLENIKSHNFSRVISA